MYRKGFISIFLIFLFIVSSVNGQITAVPFLLNAPDARTGAMGDAGVALSADANSLSNNPSKLAFIKQGYGFSASYNPWLKSLVADMNLGYLSGFYKISDRNTIGASLRYFSLGKVQLLGNNRKIWACTAQMSSPLMVLLQGDMENPFPWQLRCVTSALTWVLDSTFQAMKLKQVPH